MQSGGLVHRRTQQQECVIFGNQTGLRGKAFCLAGKAAFASPEVRTERPVYLWKVTQKPSAQIDQVNALVKQLAAATQVRIGSPLAIVSRPSPMAVGRSNVKRLPDSSRVHQLASTRYCGMVP